MRRPWCRVIEVEKQILEEISNIGSGRDIICGEREALWRLPRASIADEASQMNLFICMVITD